MTAEEQRLQAERDRTAYWSRWGPYLSERQWGTVREDYSADGDAWNYFPHDHARSRAYRWGEDGIAGISDNHQRLCFAIALWNGVDPILKERMFGLNSTEGNHGEDVKEYYFYLDNTPSHSYMKCLYKYPQQAFPYEQLLEENQQRGYQDPEFELLETGIFDADQYFDVYVEYAKNSPEDILIWVHVANRAAEAKTLHLLPTLWFRNSWSWGYDVEKPRLELAPSSNAIAASHPELGQHWLYFQESEAVLFTENETNSERLFNVPNPSPYVKDGIHNYLIHGQQAAVNPEQTGTKAAIHYVLTVPAGETRSLQLRLTDIPPDSNGQAPFANFESIFHTRQQEANAFYDRVTQTCQLTDDERSVQRQAFAGMLWTKQFYYFVLEDWLKGDPAGPAPPPERQQIRNHDWLHLFNDDILSMPDKWEFPWYAVWDMAFHVLPLAMIDPQFAKRQLQRLTREWYMHPNGQLPAYEWSFSDGNPPLLAWSAMRVYQIEQAVYGRKDRKFLERVFQKLLLNFTWWTNRVDTEGRNVFQGGFLGMDNIGVFDRNSTLPGGGYLTQSDGTSWMAMYALNMLTIALELAKENSAYEDIASKFFEHFLRIANAMNGIGEAEMPLWDDEDGFYYDALHFPHCGKSVLLKVRSLVGLVPLFAVTPMEPATLEQFPDFKRRTEWFIQHRPDLTSGIACMQRHGQGDRRLLAIVDQERLHRLLTRLLDENEFLSEYGIRSISKYHAEHPYVFEVEGQRYEVNYEPAESRGNMFGGNSNWRGPIWLQMNLLIVEALQEFYIYFGDDFKVECPTGSGREMTLREVAINLSQRLIKIFTRDGLGQRPVFGNQSKFQTDPHWRDYILFHEYYNGETGMGLGASHQTGWAGVIAKLIQLSSLDDVTNQVPELLKRQTLSVQ
ncbi:MAG TPA: glucosidase [Leptolyngbyaceae cyanobacterium M33_DOE_097]|uniref:Glucosidase n=1 Tax=Oscillatoriales cyanobacterium SpSt-418 TaxID=2282169 RepID=A0A7C3KCZ0_9CYAN|nr:glucosidase [Leptolyngbyaceae cyanobacterium M33_DOE_097]